MAPRRREKQQLARLCDLVAASLLPHLEPGPSLPRELTREDERRLLLALSKVNKAIRGWDQDEEQRSESDQETVSCSTKIHSCSLPSLQHLDDGFGCLANIVSILVGYLSFCSDYVKHSAGNILVAISSTLIKFESIWIQFIELVWVAIHAASTCVHNVLPSKTDSNSSNITITSTSITTFMEVLNLRTHSINGHMMKMPWESVQQLDAGLLASLAEDNNDLAQSGILRGSFLQLLSSLLDETYLEGTDGHDMYVNLVDIVPKLAGFLQERDVGPKSIYQYSKHKILMIMMRLKPYMQQDCSHIICWLKLLRKYFEDLLHEPISQNIAKPDNCLEGSPFLLNMVGSVEIQDKSTRHLQRRTIYLFLSCCVCLSSNRKNGGLQCSCNKDDCLLGHEVQGCIDHCNCFALSEISHWFQRFYLDRSFDTKSSTDFALSFLQLYLEEDDMLFSILLQLLDAPLIFMKMDTTEATELIVAKLSQAFSTHFTFSIYFFCCCTMIIWYLLTISYLKM